MGALDRAKSKFDVVRDKLAGHHGKHGQPEEGQHVEIGGGESDSIGAAKSDFGDPGDAYAEPDPNPLS